MELFKTEALRKEYRELVNEILPKVLECLYCNISSCKYHKKLDATCNLCRQARCRACYSFNISRQILLDGSNEETKNYLNCFIVDFLNLSDESIKNFFPEIKVEFLKRDKINFKKSYVKSQKNRSQVINQTLPSDVRTTTFQHGRFKRKVFYKS